MCHLPLVKWEKCANEACTGYPHNVCIQSGKGDNAGKSRSGGTGNMCICESSNWKEFKDLHKYTKGAGMFKELTNEARDGETTYQQPASSSTCIPKKERTRLETYTGSTVSEETRKQMRLKYDQMGIDDAEEWCWPDGPLNKSVTK